MREGARLTSRTHLFCPPFPMRTSPMPPSAPPPPNPLALAAVSTGILATLLTEMDGAHSATGVIVVAATNRPSALDPALLRPGRLELHIEVPLPDADGRAAILRVHTRSMRLAADVDLRALAADGCTAGWSGAQLANLCREAGMQALREDLDAGAAAARHFAVALSELRPAVALGVAASE